MSELFLLNLPHILLAVMECNYVPLLVLHLSTFWRHILYFAFTTIVDKSSYIADYTLHQIQSSTFKINLLLTCIVPVE